MKSFLDQIRESEQKPIVIEVTLPPVTREECMEAREFYYRDWINWKTTNRKKEALKNLKSFDWVAEHLDGMNYEQIAEKWNTTEHVIRDGIRRARGRIDIYLKIKKRGEQ